MLRKFLLAELGDWLERHSTRILAVSPVIGLLWQDLAAALMPAVVPFAVLSMLLACTRIEGPTLRSRVGHPGMLAVGVAWLTLGAPLLVFGLAQFFLPLGSPLLAGMVLNAAAPALLSSIAFAFILGVDPIIALMISVLSTTVAPFTVPAMLGILGVGAVGLSASNLLVRLLVVVLIAFGGAYLIRRTAGQARIRQHEGLIQGGVVLAIFTFGIGMMDGFQERLIHEPEKTLLFIALAFAVNAGLQLLAGLSVWLLDRRLALVAAMLSGNRNMAMMLAVILGVAHPDVVLFVICTQLPMFILPLFTRPLFRKLAEN